MDFNLSRSMEERLLKVANFGHAKRFKGQKAPGSVALGKGHVSLEFFGF